MSFEVKQTVLILTRSASEANKLRLPFRVKYLTRWRFGLVFIAVQRQSGAKASFQKLNQRADVCECGWCFMSVNNPKTSPEIPGSRFQIDGELPKPVSPQKLISASLIVAGCLQILLGVGCIASPGLAAFAVELIIGMIFLMAGVAELLSAWNLRPLRGPFWFLPATCMVFAGAVLLAYPLSGIVTLALVVGVLFAVEGTLRLLLASNAEHQKTLVRIDGLLCVLTGVVILLGWPGDSGFIIGIVVGLRLILSGLVLLMTGRSIGKMRRTELHGV